MLSDRIPPFRRLLVANRAEIAVRVIRACAELGIESIAVYSDADQRALHTRLADQARRLGPGPAIESYLSAERILDVARTTGAEAIHPGYGFLAESADFAEQCSQAGLAWIGPPPAAMRLAGDKAAARQLAARHGVPIVPGYDGADQSDAAFVEAAATIGFPLLVKAAGGGGGRGMRAVTEAASLADALASARREAQAAFGDSALVLERLVLHARHVEVQVLGDQHGHLVYLGDRDCSVQRRHQKVIEESPAPGLSDDLRRALGEAALTVARAAGYTNAGTCEFLVDSSDAFWFIEMNARLQVEHPVTELVIGVDLVRHQIEIAAGRPLALRQNDLVPRGHAVECRLYAEDPARDFIPSTGRIERLRLPIGPGLRFDLGYADGDVLPQFYDAMLGKLIAYAEDRTGAIVRARRALDGLLVEGIATNGALLTWVLDSAEFRAGQATTDLLETQWHPQPAEPASALMLAAAAARELSAHTESTSPTVARSWSIASQGLTLFLADQAGASDRPIAVRADAESPGLWRVSIADDILWAAVDDDRVGVRSDGSEAPETTWTVIRAADGLTVQSGEQQTSVRLARPPSPEAISGGARTGERGAGIRAPMPGRIVRVDAEVGASVPEHQPLLVLEAMKIEHVVAAPRSGVVSAVHCTAGESVVSGQLLIELEPV